MKKFGVFLLVLLLTPLLAGLYGMLHDQLTYSICPEYYTKFKFYQFGFSDAPNEAILPHPRMYVAAVGFLATWWVGIFIGIFQGLVGLIHPNAKRMAKIVAKATLMTLLVAFVTGMLGLLYGKFILANGHVDWWLPENLVDRQAFITVGSMHNFSYSGGLIGLIVGILYQVRQNVKWKRSAA